MTIDPKKYQNSDTRQLATDLNEILSAGGGGGQQCSPHIVTLVNDTFLSPAGVISFSVQNAPESTDPATLNGKSIFPGDVLGFSNTGNNFFGSQTFVSPNVTTTLLITYIAPVGV
jgi:hypothetical protein